MVVSSAEGERERQGAQRERCWGAGYAQSPDLDAGCTNVFTVQIHQGVDSRDVYFSRIDVIFEFKSLL